MRVPWPLQQIGSCVLVVKLPPQSGLGEDALLDAVKVEDALGQLRVDVLLLLILGEILLDHCRIVMNVLLGKVREGA